MYYGIVKQNIRGMTLVEMLVVIALYTIVLLALTNNIVAFYRFNSYTIAQAYQVDGARRGMQFLVRDLREMTYADNGTFPLARMQSNLIGFYSDIDRDNSVEYVEYQLASTTFTKRIYNATGTPPVYNGTPSETIVLSTYVQNINQATSTFLYYDENGNRSTASSTVTDIRYIEAKIIVNIDPVRDPGQFMLRSSSALRNLKENF